LFKHISNNQQFLYFARVMVALFVNIGVCYIQEFKAAYHSDLQLVFARVIEISFGKRSITKSKNLPQYLHIV